MNIFGKNVSGNGITVINGKVYKGNVTIVNGRVIGEDSCNDSGKKEFDETKVESANGISRITVDSNINVIVSASNTSDVVAHMHGSAITDDNLNFSMQKLDNEIKISVVAADSSSGCNNVSIVSIGAFNCSFSNCSFAEYSDLVLAIQIPSREFENLSVESKNGNIEITSSVKANTISVESKNGNIDVSSCFQTLNVEAKNGNVAIDSEATCNVSLAVVTKNGNVNVSLGNIGTSEVSVNSKNGNCINSPRLGGKYAVFGYITSKNGNARFR